MPYCMDIVPNARLVINHIMMLECQASQSIDSSIIHHIRSEYHLAKGENINKLF